MRAGGFAEPRVIRLINRRFVPFFFNTSGVGQGDDEGAAAFVDGKLENSFAYLSAFLPDAAGTNLGSSALYASKDELFQYLLGLLRAHPELAWVTTEEAAVFDAAEHGPCDVTSLLAAAMLHEELGQYTAAVDLAERAIRVEDITTDQWARGFRVLAAIARYQKQWSRVADLCAWARAIEAPDGHDLLADIELELAYRHLAANEYEQARERLESAIVKHPRAKRSGELRFYAGVASYFMGREDEAEFHWCWVNEHIPGDVMARRCFVAAARKGMPYSNPELGGFSASGMIGGNTRIMKEAYATARGNFLRLRDRTGGLLPVGRSCQSE